ncbi:hypothetical protein FKW77_009924 [Venturia effusa]|uniref:CorA-like transporter domain-containing protein n=1 Tax=Venturia effusa TaxID=50376 RepID=A0A517L680_9PEZI|nr:hypothetical protein FKW77_009924 [Venturia effusa]
MSSSFSVIGWGIAYHEAEYPLQSPWIKSRLDNYAEIREHFQIDHADQTEEPLCRLIFIWGRSSRDVLFTSSKMFLLTLTYLQALPAYLDHLFPFGNQQYPRDPYFSGFRCEDRFSDAVRGPTISELGRSGCDIRMCYTLKSAERTNKSSPATWSIRQTSIYHSFDVKTGRSTWIVVKGDDLIKQRLQQVTNSIENNRNALCDWAGQNWRWYLNHLEERVQMETRHAASVLIGDADAEQPKIRLLRSDTGVRDCSPQGLRDVSATRNSPPPPYPLRSPPQLPGPRPHEKPKDNLGFGIKQVQMVQCVQDKAGEALLVIESNANVIAELREYYSSVVASQGWPNELRHDCAGDLARFDKSAETAEKDLRRQFRRAETLRSFLEDRKALLNGILESNQQNQAQQSANKMQNMTEGMQILTEEMHALAFKTQREAVSMKIITLVTLFFLPATFIASLMNTTIVQWKSDEQTGETSQVFQWLALKFFLYTVLPLTASTFCAWFVVQKRFDRKARLQGRDLSSMEKV